jgi:hypothetical protein
VYKLWSSSLCRLSSLPPHILFSTLFSNKVNLRSSRTVRSQVSHPYRTKGTIMVTIIHVPVCVDYGEDKVPVLN